MTHNEMKKKVLALIEEVNPDSENLTDDPDIQAKYIYVANQILYELARNKKIPKYVEMEVSEGDTVDFSFISMFCGSEVYQISLTSGVRHTAKANGTVFKILEDGTLEVECFVYPKRITEENADKYVFDISPDALEVMPYGVAADLLKSDVSAEYGAVYATRYETMLQRLDPRYAMTSVSIEGGVKI